MSGALWAFLKALFVVIPIIVLAVRDGRIKSGTEKEVIDAFTKANEDRIKRAIDARDAPDDGLPDDEFDRDRH